MKVFNAEKSYLMTGVIGVLTAVLTLPIAIKHFCMESRIFSALVPSIVVASLVAIFSLSVYNKGSFRLYKSSMLEAKKLLALLIVNIIAVILILN